MINKYLNYELMPLNTNQLSFNKKSHIVMNIKDNFIVSIELISIYKHIATINYEEDSFLELKPYINNNSMKHVKEFLTQIFNLTFVNKVLYEYKKGVLKWKI